MGAALFAPTRTDHYPLERRAAPTSRRAHVRAQINAAIFLLMALAAYLAHLRISWKAAAVFGLVLLASDLYEIWQEAHPSKRL